LIKKGLRIKKKGKFYNPWLLKEPFGIDYENESFGLIIRKTEYAIETAPFFSKGDF